MSLSDSDGGDLVLLSEGDGGDLVLLSESDGGDLVFTTQQLLYITLISHVYI